MENVFNYKGKPLVRQGNFLFYGIPTDEFILFMNILESKKEGNIDVATKVLVQIQNTSDTLSYNDKVIKQCEKNNFFDAFEIGMIWLERELKKTPGNASGKTPGKAAGKAPAKTAVKAPAKAPAKAPPKKQEEKGKKK